MGRFTVCIQVKISAIHCVISVNEAVNYYIKNSSKVYVCTLDASKAFDMVNLLTLFKKLFEHNMCPLFLRFFIHSYWNQKMRIKLNASISGSFDTSNGVKQEGVLSSLLFNVYLDELILLLREQGVECHMNGMFVGAFCYATCDVHLRFFLCPSSCWVREEIIAQQLLSKFRTLNLEGVS